MSRLRKTPKTEEELDPEMRAYYEQEWRDMHNAVVLTVVGPYSLHITFDDGKEVTIDFEDALRYAYRGPMYEPLLDPEFFAQAQIMYGGIVTWPNGTDWKPAYLYDWPKYVATYVAEQKAARLAMTTA